MHFYSPGNDVLTQNYNLLKKTRTKNKTKPNKANKNQANVNKKIHYLFLASKYVERRKFRFNV